MAPGHLVFVLVNAIKEMAAKNAALEARNPIGRRRLKMSDYGMVLELLGLPTSAAVLVHAGELCEDKDEIERVREMARRRQNRRA